MYRVVLIKNKEIIKHFKSHDLNEAKKKYLEFSRDYYNVEIQLINCKKKIKIRRQ